MGRRFGETEDDRPRVQVTIPGEDPLGYIASHRKSFDTAIANMSPS